MRLTLIFFRIFPLNHKPNDVIGKNNGQSVSLEQRGLSSRMIRNGGAIVQQVLSSTRWESAIKIWRIDASAA